jgi:hypothetical protein
VEELDEAEFRKLVPASRFTGDSATPLLEIPAFLQNRSAWVDGPCSGAIAFVQKIAESLAVTIAQLNEECRLAYPGLSIWVF